MKSALDVHRALLDRAVPHEIVRLRTRLLTADDLPRVLDLDRGCVAVRCYAVDRADSRSFAAVLVPAGTLPSPTALLDALDARSVSPATGQQINAVTDYAAGLVSPICLPADVELLADAALGTRDVSYCAVGEARVALGIRTRDLLVVTGARVTALTGPSPAPEPRREARVLHLDRATAARSAGARSTG